MNTNCTLIPYKQTGYFSKIVIDYLNDNEQLKSFYQHPFSLNGVRDAIKVRQQFAQQRKILVNELKQQYKNIPVSLKLQSNIELLGNENSFTISTAHQPVIFSGPIYFIYKILHVIKLAAAFSKQLPEYNFIPVFYMGSEDADLDELGSITINQKNYQWATKQTGAVGRMKVDKAFIEMMEEMQSQLGVERYGNEIVSIFKNCYKEHETIQQCTLKLVNELFGEFGLIVLIPDNANLKRLFNPVVKKELNELFSHNAVNATLSELEKHYRMQAGGRELNLFYLIDDKRERIEIQNSKFTIRSLALSFELKEILEEVKMHPERFSANVILRGVFQGTILPDVAFVGGGGELAYWLELKNVFKEAGVPYPVLLLRNSFLLIENKLNEIADKLGLKPENIFLQENEIINLVVKAKTQHNIHLNREVENAEALYNKIKQIAMKVDVSLQDHVVALKTIAVKRLKLLENKMLKAEKKKFETETQQIQKLKENLFPNDSLQERVENIAGFYAKYGKDLLNVLLENSLTLEQQFMVLSFYY